MRKYIIIIMILLSVFVVAQLIQSINWRLIPDCVAEGLQHCERIIGNAYEFSSSWGGDDLDIFTTITLPPDRPYNEDLINCYDPTDITVARYDTSREDWVIIPSEIDSNLKRVRADINRLGIYAIVGNVECIPTSCEFGGYMTRPSRLVNVDERIIFYLCNIVRGCEPSKARPDPEDPSSSCDRNCIAGTDKDCVAVCTPQKGDCCLISRDGICDLDCAEAVDPDCLCQNFDDGCCLAVRDGICDPNCGRGDPDC